MKQLLIVMMLFWVPLSSAQADEVILLAASQQERISLDQAVELVRQERGGKVVAAQTVNEGGQRYHRIKVVSDRGEVRVIYVNASNGQIE